MPTGAITTTNVGPPQVQPTFAPQAHQGYNMPQAHYSQYVAPTGLNPQFLGPSMGMQPSPMASMGFNAGGPFGPPSGPQIPSIPIPLIAMPPGMPPLMSSCQALPWECLNEDLMAMVHRKGCLPCMTYGQHIHQAIQSDLAFALANAAALRDRQIRMHKFF